MTLVERLRRIFDTISSFMPKYREMEQQLKDVEQEIVKIEQQLGITT